MSNFIIYILTDSNRKRFEIGLSSNIFGTVMELQQSNNFIFNLFPHHHQTFQKRNAHYAA